MQLNTIEEIIEDLRNGRMVVVMDDEDRENEGDLVLAAEKTTPVAINFMAKYGRGLICLTLTKEHCRQLRLPLMVNADDRLETTNFTVSIEAAEGVTTGISAADRATTILAAVNPDARPEDLVQPGHVFPLMAQPGGVLVRAGHTEAGCDLARLAGLTSAAVIVEILNEDGSMARRADLESFAATHDLKIGTIADLIEYRVRNETTVERVNECALPTEWGDFRLVAYQDVVDQEVHLALVKGRPQPGRPVLVRVHVQNTLCDLLGSTRNDCGWPLRSAMRQIDQAGEGIVVILRNHDTSRELVQRMQDHKRFSGEQRSVPTRGRIKDKELRTYGVGAQILSDLGVTHMRVMSAPKNLHALAGFHLEITEFVDFE